MSGPKSFTLIDGDRATTVPAAIAGESVRIAPEALRAATGWELKPEGLCRDDACVPVRDRAALGTSAAERSGRMATLEAPDFELPDLQGRRHRLSHHRGKKVLLIAYASW